MHSMPFSSLSSRCAVLFARAIARPGALVLRDVPLYPNEHNDKRTEHGGRTMKDCRQFYIDGQWVNPTTPHDLSVINPATEAGIAVISLGIAADVDKAVAAAKRAFASYSETTVEERLAILQRIIEVYQSKYEEMATTISEEMGAPLWLSRAAQAAAGLGHFFEMVKVLGTFKFEELKGSTLM